MTHTRSIRMDARPATILLAILLFLAGAACEAPGAPPPEDPAGLPEGTEPGERAPPLTGATAGESEFELSPGASDYTVVVFYRGYGCGLCRLRLEELGSHHDAYAAAGAELVAAAPEPPARIEEAEEAAGGGVIGVSVERPTLDAWEVVDERGMVLPATFLLDRSGVIRYRHVGRNAGDRASDMDVLAAIRQDRERRGDW